MDSVHSEELNKSALQNDVSPCFNGYFRVFPDGQNSREDIQ